MRPVVRSLAVAVIVVVSIVAASAGAGARCVTVGADSVSQTVCGLP